MNSNLDLLSEINRLQVREMDIRQDHSNLHERLVCGEETHVNPIGNSCLLKVSEIFCVVDVPLRIQIPVTDFNWMIEAKLRHSEIIPSFPRGQNEIMYSFYSIRGRRQETFRAYQNQRLGRGKDHRGAPFDLSFSLGTRPCRDA